MYRIAISQMRQRSWSSPAPQRPVIAQSQMPASSATEPPTTTLAQESISPRGMKQINQYILEQTLGSGAYSKVKLAYNTDDNRYYAIKICNKSFLSRRKIGIGPGSALDNVRRELAILKKLDHPNIVKLYEVIDDPSNDKLFMVMEHVENGPLMRETKFNKPLRREDVWRHLRDVICGLEYLHKQRIVHRDIKPSNLLLAEDGRVKISDFGVSQFFDSDNDSLHRTAGSPAFTAPEICEYADSFSGRAADVWALGVTLYLLLFGRLPFTADNIPDLYHNIVHQPLVIPEDTPPPLRNLLRTILDKCPVSRITIPELKVHEWLTMNGTMPLPHLLTLPVEVSPHEISAAFTTVDRLLLLVKLKARLARVVESARTRIRARGESISAPETPRAPFPLTPQPRRSTPAMENIVPCMRKLW